MIKNSTNKFRENFRNYDHTNPNINILLALLDAILEMMTITNYDDVDNINKLASFVKLLSSTKLVSTDFNGAIDNITMDEDMINAIYACCIMPILDNFDKKYREKSHDITTPKDFINEVKEFKNVHDQDNNLDYLLNIDENNNKVNYNKNDTACKSNDTLFNIIDLPEIEYHIRDDTNNDEESHIPVITQIAQVDYKILFEILKTTSIKIKSMYLDYINIIDKSYINNDAYLIDLRDIYNSARLSTSHPNNSIRILSTKICNICTLFSKIIKMKGDDLNDIKIVNNLFKDIDKITY